MKKLALFFPLLLVLLSGQACGDVVINEVHPAGNEWVEIYNNGSSGINLTGWKVGDEQKNDSLNGLKVKTSSLGLIIDDNLTCSQFNVSECIEADGKLGGWGLADEGENLTLYNSSGNVVDKLVWESDPGKSYSIGRVPDGGDWNYSLSPTPGGPNYNGSESSKKGTVNRDGSSPDEEDDGPTEESESESRKRNRIQVKKSPDSAKFGGILNIEAEVSRNGTQAHTIYARVERRSDGWDVSEDTKIKLGDRGSGRNQNYTVTIPVLLRPNCDGRYEDGKYELVVKGLGVKDTEKIEISGTKESACKEVEKESSCNISCNCSEKQENYEIFSYEESTETGDLINTSVLLRNDEEEAKELEIYSYVYEGSTPINEKGWHGNSRTVKLEGGGKRALVMRNRIKESAEPGEYELKVRIKDEVDLLRTVEVDEGDEDKEDNVTTMETGDDEPDKNATASKETNRSETGPEEVEEGITGRTLKSRDPIEQILDFLEGLLS